MYPEQKHIRSFWLTLIAATFEDQQGKTKLTLQHAGIPKTGKEREMCQEGWSQTLDRLVEHVERKQ